MLNLKDGTLFQWDTGRKVVIDLRNGHTIDKVQFYNGIGDNAYPATSIETINGEILAGIPNSLLCYANNLTVYLMTTDEDGVKTQEQITLAVNRRAKPEDYIFTDDEFHTYKVYDERLLDLEKNVVTPDKLKESTDTEVKALVPEWAREVSPDVTLTKAGEAADAAKVGNAISKLEKSVSSPYNSKGSVESFDKLPSKDNVVNDTYYVVEEKCKFTWNGTEWYQSSMSEAEYAEELSQLRADMEAADSQLSSEIVDVRSDLEKGKVGEGSIELSKLNENVYEDYVSRNYNIDFESVTQGYQNIVMAQVTLPNAFSVVPKLRIKGTANISADNIGSLRVCAFNSAQARKQYEEIYNGSNIIAFDVTLDEFENNVATLNYFYIGFQIGNVATNIDISDLQVYVDEVLYDHTLTFNFNSYCSGTISNTDKILYGLAKRSDLHPYKPYESGYIHFMVGVNQEFQNLDVSDKSVTDKESIKSVNCILKLPSTYSPNGEPTKLVMMCHGAGNIITENNQSYWEEKVNAMFENGYALFDVNGSNNDYTDYADHMSSPRTLSAYKKAYDYIVSNYNVTKQIYLAGVSMGGLTALNFANRFPCIINVTGLLNPITAMYKGAWLYPWYGADKEYPNGRTRTKIAIEHNFNDKSGLTYEEEKIIGFDPLLNKSVMVDGKRYNSFPSAIRIWHGENDTTARIENITELIDAYRNYGVDAEIRNIDDTAHVTTDIMYEELAMWFNRW